MEKILRILSSQNFSDFLPVNWPLSTNAQKKCPEIEFSNFHWKIWQNFWQILVQLAGQNSEDVLIWVLFQKSENLVQIPRKLRGDEGTILLMFWNLQCVLKLYHKPQIGRYWHLINSQFWKKLPSVEGGRGQLFEPKKL